MDSDRPHPRYRRYAFFDLDGTLIADTSLITFYAHYLRTEFGTGAAERGAQIRQSVAARRSEGIERDQLNAWFYQQYFGGLEVARLRDLAHGWLAQRMADPAFLHCAMVDRLASYRRQGVGTVIVTGSFREVVQPLAAHLGVDCCLWAPLEEAGGRYTGAMTGVPMIGAGKARAVLDFLGRQDVAPAVCTGYGDDESDIGFLSVLGQPAVVAGASDGLLAHARRCRWPILDPRAARPAPLSPP